MYKFRKTAALLLALVLLLGAAIVPAGAADSDFSINEEGVLTKYNGPGGDVVIPGGVTEIGPSAFSGCSTMTSVTIPNSVTFIGYMAFSGCTGLTSIEIPGYVTEIVNYAFSNCTGLTSVTIPASVTEIGSGAFYKCTSLASVTFAGKPPVLGDNVFTGTPWQKSMGEFVVVDGTLLAYQGGGGEVVIPDTVTAIGDAAFFQNSRITGVVIPDSVKTIGKQAFSYCPKLARVTIGRGVTSIEAHAFERSKALADVVFMGSVASIDSTAFKDTPWENQTGDFAVVNGTLTRYKGNGGDVVIPDGITAIGSNAFTYTYANKITSVVLPASVTQIGDSAFCQCWDLADINLPNGLTRIGTSAFAECRSLTSIDIPDSVTEIGEGAFSGCTGLTTVDIPDSITAIPEKMFSGCTALTSVDLPSRLTKIGSSAFHECKNLSSITIPDSVTTIEDHAFFDCKKLPSIIIPGSVTAIGENAFAGCNGVETLKIRTSGIDVGPGAFPSFTKNKANRLTVYQLMRNQWVNIGCCVKPQSERITSFSNQLTAGLTSDYEKAKAICEWVSRNIKYDYDYYYYHEKDYSDVSFEPEDVLDTRLAVCAGYSSLTRALLQAQGIPALYVAGDANGAKGWEGHAWNEAYIDGRWILIDTTWGPEYFDMSLSDFVKKHSIDYRVTVEKKDIPSAWAKDEVRKAMAAGLIPNDLQADYRSPISRERFCRLMVTLVEQTTGQDIDSYIASRGLAVTDPFADTDTPEVLAAYALHIANGTSATTFDPYGRVTRQEAATMLARTARLLGLTAGSGEAFADSAYFSPWAAQSIALISGLTDPTTGAKVMNGTGNDLFSPLGTYTCEQAIMTSLRLFHCAEEAIAP